MAAENERTSAWGAPAPAYETGDDGPGAGRGQNTHGAARDPAGDGRGDGKYESTGPTVPGWETVAPALVPENGSRRPGTGRAPRPGSPLGIGYATITEPRQRRVLRGIRSGVALTVIYLALGVAAAASLGAIVWLIAMAIHHAAAN